MRASGRGRAWLLLGPSVAWLAVFLAAPMALAGLYSFYEPAGFGGVQRTLTLGNYRAILDSPIYLGTILRTLELVGLTTAACLRVGYPAAYCLARRAKGGPGIAYMIVLTIPFWTSSLVRTISWLPLLGRNGAFNYVLLRLRLTDHPLDLFLFSDFALLLVMAQSYVVFMVGPIFVFLAAIPDNVVAAARAHGASPWQVFRHVTLPMSLPGVVVGAIFVVVLSMGNYEVPKMIGGIVQTVGLVVFNTVTVLNWPRAAAFSAILVAMTLVSVVVLLRLADVRRAIER